MIQNKEKFKSLYVGIFLFFYSNAANLSIVLKIGFFAHIISLMSVIFYFSIWRFPSLKLARPLIIFMGLIVIFYFYTILVGLFVGIDSFSFTYLAKYVAICLTLIGFALVITKQSVYYFIGFSCIYAFLLSFSSIQFQQLGYHGLNYLQASHPVAAGLIFSTVLLFERKIPVPYRIFFLASIPVYLIFLNSLWGRSPLLQPLFVIFLLLILFLWNQSKALATIVFFAALSATPLLIGYLINNLAAHKSERLYRLFYNFSEEPRAQLWEKAFQHIQNKPFGNGPESSWHLIGYTPHNFFIEILVSSGIIGIIPIFLLTAYGLDRGIRSTAYSATHMAIFGLWFYFLVRSMIGGAIGTSYDFLMPLLISLYLSTQRVAGPR